MAKLTIRVSLKDGEKIYSDSEGHSGKIIKSEIKKGKGTRVVWTTDKKSGIKDISGINIIGDCKFFSKGPIKKSCTKWVALVSKKATGKIEYELFVTPEKEAKKSKDTVKAKSAGTLKDDNGPLIKIRI